MLNILKNIKIKKVLEAKDNNIEQFNLFDMIQYTNSSKFNIHKILFYFIYFFKIVITLIFLPLILIFLAFNNKSFLKIVKQVVVILYFIFFIIFIYTLFNQNKNIINDTKTVINIPINKNKIKNF